MLRFVSKRIFGAASRKAVSSLPELLFQPLFYQERVVYRCNNNPRNFSSTVGTVSVETIARLRKFAEMQFASNAVLVQDAYQFSEKDLSTEESLWALYERWMKYYKITRSPCEIQERFKAFKDDVICLHNMNKSNPACCRGLDGLADLCVDGNIICDWRDVKDKYKFSEKDLLTEESLCTLYEGWMKHFEILRSSENIEERFNAFKDKAISVHNSNKLNPGCIDGLDEFADRIKDPQCRKRGYSRHVHRITGESTEDLLMKMMKASLREMDEAPQT